ncbi:MAG: hypothetical protein EBS24_08600 [Chitinophagia bacterium]|nr:hypothetical protein [Chitinophagia bacterium]
MPRKLWQLIDRHTKTPLNDPVLLPDQWGPIFGMHGVKDRLSDLSWVNLPNLAWIETDIEVPDPPPPPTEKDQLDDRIKRYLAKSDWAMLSDVPMTISEKQEWIEYRKELRDIKKQKGYPEKVTWPIAPDERKSDE